MMLLQRQYSLGFDMVFTLNIVNFSGFYLDIAGHCEQSEAIQCTSKDFCIRLLRRFTPRNDVRF